MTPNSAIDKNGSRTKPILTKEDLETLEELHERYHNGGLKDLPAQVYFDVGRLFGILFKYVRLRKPK